MFKHIENKDRGRSRQMPHIMLIDPHIEKPVPCRIIRQYNPTNTRHRSGTFEVESPLFYRTEIRDNFFCKRSVFIKFYSAFRHIAKIKLVEAHAIVLPSKQIGR